MFEWSNNVKLSFIFSVVHLSHIDVYEICFFVSQGSGRVIFCCLWQSFLIIGINIRELRIQVFIGYL